MKIYPAIDILGGKAVRLKQGRKDDATTYGDPVEMASKWVAQGAEWLHVVDLDGAFVGGPQNLDVMRAMAAAVPNAKIQAGGGIRSMAAVESLLEAGIRQVIFASGRPMPQHPGLRLLHGLGIELVYMYYSHDTGNFQYHLLECRPRLAVAR